MSHDLVRTFASCNIVVASGVVFVSESHVDVGYAETRCVIRSKAVFTYPEVGGVWIQDGG